MPRIFLLGLPKEILFHILEYLDTADITHANLTCAALNSLCERKIYRNVSVIRYAYSHSGETNYDAIRGFFEAVTKRPERLLYIQKVDARLELRLDRGLYHASQLFEALPKMMQLTSLCIEIVGGIRPSRESRALEQSMIWGCTFERGRLAMYKFFRKDIQADEPRGIHALRNLRTLKIFLPAFPIGLQSDLIAYSVLQHKTVNVLLLKHVLNASLAPPKLPEAADTIRVLALIGCQLPQAAYQSIFEAISCLKHLDYRPARPMGSLLKMLGRHSNTLQSLSIKMDAVEMKRLDLRGFQGLTNLCVHNPQWDEERKTVCATDDDPQSLHLPALFPPCLRVLTMKNFHGPAFCPTLLEWIGFDFVLLKHEHMPALEELRLESEYLGDEHTVNLSPLYVMTAAGFHIDEKVLHWGGIHFREHGVTLLTHDKVYFGHESHSPGPYDIGAGSMIMNLDWLYQPEQWDSDTMSRRVSCEMSPRGAIERFLLLRGNTLNGQLSWQSL